MSYELLKDKYQSPRITGELLDCSMPMSFDQYSVCGFGCLYCFSFFQRSLGKSADNYLAKRVKAVNVNKIKRMFDDPDKYGGEFKEIIKNKITLQFGGLSDPFCPIEEQMGIGYELLKYFREIEYPICFSSKGDLLLKPQGEKYLELFNGAKNWSYKASIITLDADKARVVEAGVPTPQRRLEVLKILSSMGVWTILRLRPFIYGLSNLTYEELIREAGKAGCKAMSTEFFCLEIRSINKAAKQYKILSDICGFDIIEFYKALSNASGYYRLNYEFKSPYFNRMKEICDEVGMNFHVSDAHGKDKGCSGSCCGLPADGSVSNFSKCQFTNALMIAKAVGVVHWSDIASTFTDHLKNNKFNLNGITAGNQACIKFKAMTSYEMMRYFWNKPNESRSPYKYFGGILYPIGLDANNDVIYEYRKKI